MSRPSQSRRMSSAALRELVNRSSIWNSASITKDDRRLLPDSYKRAPENDPFRRDASVQHQSLWSYKQPGDSIQDDIDQNTDTSTDDTVVVGELAKPWIFFGRDSSCHGVKNIESRQRTRAARTLWLFITLGMLSGLLYTVAELTVTYYEYNTVTKTEVRVDNDLLFPSITFCNICPYKRQVNGTVNPVSRLMTQTTIFARGAEIDRSTLDLPMIEVQENYSYTAKETFWYAIYDGIALDVGESFEHVNTPYGRCFTFNGPNYIKKHGVRKNGFDGRYSGLRVMVQIHQLNYLIMDDMTAGLRLFISQHPETPRLDKDGIDITPGTAVKVALSPSKFKFLPPPYTSYGSVPCVETEHLNLTHKMYDHPFYSYTECIDQCQDLFAARNCSCYSSTLKVKGLPPCTVDQDFHCLQRLKTELTHNQRDLECDCPRPCSFYHYDTTLSSSQMPSRVSSEFILSLLEADGDPLDIVRDNYIDVRIFLASNIIREETHEPQYTFNSMLAYLGGQMGFFLGASLVTMTEFLEAVIWAVYLFFQKKIVNMGRMDPMKKQIIGKEEKNTKKKDTF